MKIIAVETDPGMAECLTFDSETHVNEDLELVCPKQEKTITPALSMENLT